MLRGDSGFRVVAREHVAARRAGEPLGAGAHPLLIPEAPVLLFEEQEASAAVDPRGEAREVEVHERKQRERLRHTPRGMLGEERRQADRLVAEIPADRRLRVRGEVALVEEQVEHLVDAREAGGQRLERRGHELVRGRRAEPVASALQTLVHVRLAREESKRDSSAVLNPQSVFRASTRRESRGMASSQQTRSIRRRSSRTSPVKCVATGSSAAACASSSAAPSRSASRPASLRTAPRRWLHAAR